jgi:hypothetical protein
MCRWEVNIKMDLQWVGGMEWIDLAQDRDRRRAVVDAIWTIGFQTTRGTSRLAANR